jgi:hypothetical protein
MIPRSRNGISDIISHHRQSRWYEEGPLKGPSDQAQFTLVPIRAEALSLTVGPPAPVVPSSRSPEAPPHGGSTRSIRRDSPPVPRCLPRSGAVSNHAGNGKACRSLTARGGGFHKIESYTIEADIRTSGNVRDGYFGVRDEVGKVIKEVKFGPLPQYTRLRFDFQALKRQNGVNFLSDIGRPAKTHGFRLIKWTS